MYRLHFTKHFTKGFFEGLNHGDSMPFGSISSAKRWLYGIDKKAPKLDYVITFAKLVDVDTGELIFKYDE